MIPVEWYPPAREQFYAIWEAADAAELPALEQVVQNLYAELSADPLEVGESRGGPRRVVGRPANLVAWRVP